MLQVSYQTVSQTMWRGKLLVIPPSQMMLKHCMVLNCNLYSTQHTSGFQKLSHSLPLRLLWLVGDASCRIAMSKHQRGWLLCSVPLHVMCLLISVYEPQKSFITVMHILAEVTVVSFSTKTTCRHLKTICSPHLATLWPGSHFNLSESTKCPLA